MSYEGPHHGTLEDFLWDEVQRGYEMAEPIDPEMVMELLSRLRRRESVFRQTLHQVAAVATDTLFETDPADVGAMTSPDVMRQLAALALEASRLRVENHELRFTNSKLDEQLAMLEREQEKWRAEVIDRLEALEGVT